MLKLTNNYSFPLKKKNRKKANATVVHVLPCIAHLTLERQNQQLLDSRRAGGRDGGCSVASLTTYLFSHRPLAGNEPYFFFLFFSQLPKS